MVRTYAKLASPLVVAVGLILVVHFLSVQMLGRIAEIGGYLIGFAVVILYIGVLVYAGLYRGTKRLADFAWGDVFEKHDDSTVDVREEDIPGDTRIFLAYVSLVIREFLSMNWDVPWYPEYRDTMLESLRENSDELEVKE